MRGVAYMGKDGAPLEICAPAEGFLGAYEWLTEHLLELEGRQHCLPAFESARAGRPSQATGLLPGVLAEQHVLPAFRDILESSPFVFPCAPAVFYERWGLRGHSPHSTGADMARFVGRRGGFDETDARELGHWLRDKNAPQPDPRRAADGKPARGIPAGKPCSRGSMSLRYSQGDGRRGEREAQLDVRARLVDMVQRALAIWARPWQELPAGTEDWEILRPAWELQADLK